jgi:hypothetical protein
MSAVRGTASRDQMSIFSAISIASSTSMPRYLTVLSIFECPSGSWTQRFSFDPSVLLSFSKVYLMLDFVFVSGEKDVS